MNIAKLFQISKLRYLRYALPVVTTAGLTAPMAIVQGVYAKHYGLSLEGLALVFLCSRVFDAITDPLIGYFSDRYHQRTGNRSPFMWVGGLLFVVSAYFIYLPPEAPSLLYFLVWMMAFYLAWTLFEIPHIAWAGELSPSSSEKVKVYSMRTIAGYSGLILFYSIPFLPLFTTHDITPETLQAVFWIAGPVMLLFLWVSLSMQFETAPMRASTTEHASKKSAWKFITDFSAHFKSVFKNSIFLRFMLAFIFVFMSTGLWYSLVFLYVDVYLGMGDTFAQVFLLAFIVGITVTPAWAWLAVRFGKKNTMILVLVLCITSFIYTGLLSPGSTTLMELIALKTVQTVGFVGFVPISLSMLSEIIDHDEWQQGLSRSGTYFAVYNFAGKNISAVATAAGLALAGAFGFDATVTQQTLEAATGLLFTISWLPTLLCLLAAPLVLKIPMDERRHEVIRRRLAQRKQREARNAERAGLVL